MCIRDSNRILIPTDPSVGSAVGFLYAPVLFEIVKSHYTLLCELDINATNNFLEGLSNEAAEVVVLASNNEALNYRRTAFMRYKGQGHEIEIELPERSLNSVDKTALQRQFEQEYQKQFSRPVPGMQIEILNWGVSVSTSVKTNAARHRAQMRARAGKQSARTRFRTITCDVTGKPVQARQLQRSELHPGATIQGPALIEEPQTTTLVSADFCASIDDSGNIHLQRTTRVN